eukprot:TRINITY_DN1618_c0_g1_i1.p1 TRINITY_DN1618_c0_g1~~TRINITY_DN1618_c0_g1_i1.p1  ORF type:complete len:181 (+),score=38.53 TRINITY_DN1618_c0_g1_i1:82-543(+)
MSDKTSNFKVLVLHGAGLNMRGKVDIEKFGKETLQDYEKRITRYAEEFDISVSFFQSNVEGELINRLYKCFDEKDFQALIINPGGFTLGYRALQQAVAQVNGKIPVIEVHVSNLATRGVLSDIAPSCIGSVAGFGLFGYSLALRALRNILWKE